MMPTTEGTVKVHQRASNLSEPCAVVVAAVAAAVTVAVAAVATVDGC